MSDLDFQGVLSRAEVSSEKAELRLHPHTFSAAPEEKPVLVIRFLKPDFDIEVCNPLLGDELEGHTSSSIVEIYAYGRQKSVTLKAERIEAAWVAYDAADHFGLYQALSAQCGRLGDDLRVSRTKISESLALVEELIRRAEVKAASSDEHMHYQASAIAVLERIRYKLKSD